VELYLLSPLPNENSFLYVSQCGLFLFAGGGVRLRSGGGKSEELGKLSGGF
jgi:hypothetical protein